MAATAQGEESLTLLSRKRSEQLDALHLDNYLSSLLHVESLSLYFPSVVQKYLPVLRDCFVPTITILQCLGNTPATRALGLQVAPSTKNQNKNVVSKLLVYSFLSFFLPKLYHAAKTQWLLQRASSSALDGNGGNSAFADVARNRRQRLIQKFFQTIDTILPILRLGLLLSCWSRGTTPNLAMVLSGLQFNPATGAVKPSSLHVLYAHRRWFHHEATRLLPMLANPILNSARETRQMLEAWTRSCIQTARRSLPFAKPLQPKGCPICQQDPIHVPYETNCGHVYCYTCLWSLVHRQQNACCLICQTRIVECVRPKDVDKL